MCWRERGDVLSKTLHWSHTHTHPSSSSTGWCIRSWWRMATRQSPTRGPSLNWTLMAMVRSRATSTWSGWDTSDDHTSWWWQWMNEWMKCVAVNKTHEWREMYKLLLCNLTKLGPSDWREKRARAEWMDWSIDSYHILKEKKRTIVTITTTLSLLDQTIYHLSEQASLLPHSYVSNLHGSKRKKGGRDVTNSEGRGRVQRRKERKCFTQPMRERATPHTHTHTHTHIGHERKRKMMRWSTTHSQQPTTSK